MLLSKLAGAALVISVSTGSVPDDGTVQHLSTQQKNAAIQSLARSATDCIARNVAAHLRLRKQPVTADLGDLIVASVPSCVGPVRAMIDAYDRFFGKGSGEAFFMGPYLDALPAAVSTLAVDRD